LPLLLIFAAPTTTTSKLKAVYVFRRTDWMNKKEDEWKKLQKLTKT